MARMLSLLGSIVALLLLASAANADVSGTWEGEAEEASSDGGTFRYPLSLVVQERADGRLAVELDAHARVPNRGDVIDVQITQSFVLDADGGAWRGRATSKRLLVNGTVTPSDPDMMILQREGDRLVGRFGSDASSTPFRLARKQATTPKSTHGGLLGGRLSFAGSWEGMVSETSDAGSFQYPVRLLVEEADGTTRIRLDASAAMPSNGSTLDVAVTEFFDARREGSRLVGRGTAKVMTVDGREVESAFDSIEAVIEGPTLVGRFGNDKNGFTPFRLSRAAEAATAAEPRYAGRWQGDGREVLSDGSVIEYPIAITIEKGSDGSFAVRGMARITVDEAGRTLEIDVDWEGVGRLADGALQVRGTKKSARVEGGATTSAQPDNATLRIDGRHLMGRVGTTGDGFTDFRLVRLR